MTFCFCWQWPSMLSSGNAFVCMQSNLGSLYCCTSGNKNMVLLVIAGFGCDDQFCFHCYVYIILHLLTEVHHLVNVVHMSVPIGSEGDILHCFSRCLNWLLLCVLTSLLLGVLLATQWKTAQTVRCWVCTLVTIFALLASFKCLRGLLFNLSCHLLLNKC